jgi:hypothetical protein
VGLVGTPPFKSNSGSDRRERRDKGEGEFISHGPSKESLRRSREVGVAQLVNVMDGMTELSSTQGSCGFAEGSVHESKVDLHALSPSSPMLGE